MVVFRVNNVIKGGAGCSCHVRPALHDASDLEPITVHDIMVQQGLMSPEMRNHLRDQKRRADERVAEADKGRRLYPNAIPAPEYADMVPPTTLDAIKKARR
jgi:hypothetical protein